MIYERCTPRWLPQWFLIRSLTRSSVRPFLSLTWTSCRSYIYVPFVELDPQALVYLIGVFCKHVIHKLDRQSKSASYYFIIIEASSSCRRCPLSMQNAFYTTRSFYTAKALSNMLFSMASKTSSESDRVSFRRLKAGPVSACLSIIFLCGDVMLRAVKTFQKTRRT